MPPPNRSHYKTIDTISHIWTTTLNLPRQLLPPLSLPEADTHNLPTSFKIPHLAQSSIALSALTASLFHSTTTATSPLPKVTIPLNAATSEFHSERLLTLNSSPVPSTFKGNVPIGGLHECADGRYVRVHDVFEVHRRAACKVVLGDEEGWKTRGEEFREILRGWDAVEFERKLIGGGGAGAVLREWEEWDRVTEGRVMGEPVLVERVPGSEGHARRRGGGGGRGCYAGVRVVEMTRVIAAPVAGRTMAAHGADVLWVTAPGLQSLPELDLDTGRGKRSVQIDVETEEGKETLWRLLEDADVFVQSYRPDSLAAKGFGVEEVVRRSKKGIVCANLSAYGPGNALSTRRGFDSLVQTASGMNVSEAEHYGDGQPSRVAPCQVLDHASGFLLAAGIGAALYRRATEGGSHEVTVSLAGTMQYLRSLGQLEGRSGFESKPLHSPMDVDTDLMEEQDGPLGRIRAPKHSAEIEGIHVGFERMMGGLGADAAEWL